MTDIFPASLQPYAPLIVGAAKAILIFAMGWVVSRWTATLTLGALRRRKIDEAVARFMSSLAQYAVLAATVVAALSAVGVQTTSVVAIIGAAGLAVGLALQGTLGHFASGVMLLVFRPFTVADVITAGGHTGKVEEIGLFATTLLTPDNLRITIPNGAVTGGSITNITVMGTRRIAIDVGIAYGEDPDHASKTILAAVSKVEGVLVDPEPAVALASFGASSVDLKVFVWAQSAAFLAVAHDCRVAIYGALNDAKIEIPYNQLVVHNASSANDAAHPRSA
ncbi:MAG: mechanosensitive ion channel family protein [Myxococcota bacterium]